jgi:hypothetical protein
MDLWTRIQDSPGWDLSSVILAIKIGTSKIAYLERAEIGRNLNTAQLISIPLHLIQEVNKISVMATAAGTKPESARSKP